MMNDHQAAVDEGQAARELADGITTEALLGALLEEIKTRYNTTRARNRQLLEAANARTRSTRWDADAPFGGPKAGEVQLKGGGMEPVITDEKAFREHVRATAPTEIQSQLVVTVRSSYTEALKRTWRKTGSATFDVVDEATGEVVTRPVPGVTMRPKDRYHSIKLTDEGKVAMTAAWGRQSVAELLPGTS